MPDYKKLKSAELAALLARRGLDVGGTKTEMLSRLVKQDAEEATAEKATLAAIHAASTAPPRSRGRETHSEQGTSKNGVDRAGAGKKSEAMRKERQEKGKGKAKQGKRASMGGYRNLFEEEDEAGQAEGWVDEETYVRELMAGETVEVPGIQVKVGGGGGQNAGIVVNMTPPMAVMRGGGGRTRWESNVPSTIRPVYDDDDDDDDDLSDASTIRPSYVLSGEITPTPGDDTEPETDLDNAEESDAYTAFGVFLVALFLSMAWIFAWLPGSMAEVGSYVAAFLGDPLHSVWESIMGPGHRA